MSRKKKRNRKCQSKKWFRSRKFNRHHIKNKCKGGKATKQNLLIMDTERHKAWHFLFQNMSFTEVAALLTRTALLKHQQD